MKLVTIHHVPPLVDAVVPMKDGAQVNIANGVISIEKPDGNFIAFMADKVISIETSNAE